MSLLTAALGKSPNVALSSALQNMAVAFQQLATAVRGSTPTPTPTPTPTSGGQATTPPATLSPLATLPAQGLPSGSLTSKSPSPSATTSLLPLIAPSSAGLALPTLSPSSTTSTASAYTRPAGSSTPNLNWPDAVAITVVAGALLAWLLSRRSNGPAFRRDSRG